MRAGINVRNFLNNMESYAEDTSYDYTYYLIVYELERMQISERIGQLRPEHMNPILLFLRDWMPAGWVGWSEKKGRRWQMDSELCEALNSLKDEFIALRAADLEYFEPNQQGDTVKTIFERICDLKLAASEKAVATVTSKIMHLLNPKLFVMWDTRIIDFYNFQPNADGYVKFLVRMKELTQQLQPYADRIKEKAEELRREACEVYGTEICSEKSLVKLIDENNWMETRRKR